MGKGKNSQIIIIVMTEKEEFIEEANEITRIMTKAKNSSYGNK